MKGVYRTSLALIASVAAITAPSAAKAQAGAPVSLVMDTNAQAKGRGQIDRLADCVRKRAPAQVEDLLAYNVHQGARLAAILFSDPGKQCVSAAAIFNSDVLIGSLFKLAYLEHASDRPLEAGDLERLAAAYPPEKAGMKLVQNMLLADCVVSRNEQGSRAVLAAAPGKSEERESLAALKFEVAACATALGLNEAAETPFITAMAQVLYRRSRGESFDPNSRPSDAGRFEPGVKCESDRPDVCIVHPAANGGAR